ncbi:hypothetical protein Desku_0735 [Desulfofundulus kuznetsovii DSM 6115]|uniref:HNH endonuclease n=1 Tax=Desulfofundulus kuznetsovii (strain DSM 6115 / VKM B-1805 / 17) TaxID=760568 RepID=A0AAU8P905_DESK7|nr:hypothetical protein Desku_0735 [Desulfofundulus kuznetsovii DSM 6115]
MFRERQCPSCYGYLDFDGLCPVCRARARYKRKVLCSVRRFHHRQRVIARRQYIIKYVWREASQYYFVTEDGWFGSPRCYRVVSYDSYWEHSKFNKEPGRLAKYNLSCGCWMCKFEKRRGILKPKYRFWQGG